MTTDKPTISSELFSTNMVTLTLQGSGGFSGPVGLAGSVVNATGAAIPGWTVTLDKPTVDLAADGAATAVATVKIPSDSTAMQGSLKVDVTSSLGSMMTSSAITVAKQLTVNLTLQGGDCVYPAQMVGTVRVPQGAKIRWVNGDAAARITIHIGDQIDGLVHQQGGTAPGAAYEQTVGVSAGQTDWYCHDRNDPKNMRLQAVP